MNSRPFLTNLARAALAALVLFLSHYNLTWAAIAVVLVPPLVEWFRRGRGARTALDLSPLVIIGVSIVLLIGLSRPPIGQPILPPLSQIGLAAIYGVSLAWFKKLKENQLSAAAAAMLMQGLSLTIVFLAAAFWHIPDAIVVAASWAASFVTASWYLQVNEERAGRLLAAAWALIVTEITWVLAVWQVNYIIGNGYVIIPQAVIIVLGVGYVMGSIHSAHTAKRLSRRRLIEYVAIAGVLLAIVVAGTHWKGSL